MSNGDIQASIYDNEEDRFRDVRTPFVFKKKFNSFNKKNYATLFQTFHHHACKCNQILLLQKIMRKEDHSHNYFQGKRASQLLQTNEPINRFSMFEFQLRKKCVVWLYMYFMLKTRKAWSTLHTKQASCKNLLQYYIPLLSSLKIFGGSIQLPSCQSVHLRSSKPFIIIDQN